MDSVVIGFIGVIAGSLTTGGVQFAAESLRRRNDSVAAARLVYGALVEADLIIGAVFEHGPDQIGTTTDGNRLLDRQQAVWDAQRDKLARVLKVMDYQLVQAAFSNLHHIDDVFEKARDARDADGGVTRLRNDPYHESRINTLHRAELIALGAGRTLRDRLRLGRDVTRLQDLNPVLAQATTIEPTASSPPGSRGMHGR